MFTLLHNPRCSKSREALALLQTHKVDFQVVEYLKHPLDVKNLQELAVKLQLPVSHFIRSKDAPKLNIELQDKTNAELLKILAQHPELLERPILISEKSAVIGRPPENLLKLLTRK